MSDYELIIIGGGPAGLTAGIYACRSRLKTLLIEKGTIGGKITLAEKVENFPGFPEGISGIELGERLLKQAKQFGLEEEINEVKEIEILKEIKEVRIDTNIFRAKTIIIATGLTHRHLGVKGEEKFLGKGVAFCALCDAPLFRGKAVAVVGGGDTALTEAIYLSKFASKVFLIHRRQKLRASPILQEQASALSNLEFLWERTVEEIIGDEEVRGLVLKEVGTGKTTFLPISGVFVAIGFEPNLPQIKGELKLDQGYILTNERMETNIQGVFAAGDIRAGSLRQAITASAEGAIAAISAYNYLKG